MSKTPVLTATCYCGTVQLELQGPPLRVYRESRALPILGLVLSRMVVCHCLGCRKETGSMFATQVRIPRSAVKVVRGEEKIVKYSRPKDKIDPETGITPNAAHCAKCGSPIWVEDSVNFRIRYGLIDAESEEAQAVLAGKLEGVDEKTNAAWHPMLELFCKRKAAWAKDWSVEGAPQRHEAES